MSREVVWILAGSWVGFRRRYRVNTLACGHLTPQYAPGESKTAVRGVPRGVLGRTAAQGSQRPHVRDDRRRPERRGGVLAAQFFFRSSAIGGDRRAIPGRPTSPAAGTGAGMPEDDRPRTMAGRRPRPRHCQAGGLTKKMGALRRSLLQTPTPMGPTEQLLGQRPPRNHAPPRGAGTGHASLSGLRTKEHQTAGHQAGSRP